MKKIFILASLLILFSCANEYKVRYQPPLPINEIYTKTGVTKAETEIEAKQCNLDRRGNSTNIDADAPFYLSNNIAIQNAHCMENKGYQHINTSAKERCLRYYKLYKEKLPICIEKGAFRE